VTTGASASMMIAAAACMMKGTDLEKIDINFGLNNYPYEFDNWQQLIWQLPDTTGLKDEFITQKCHRNPYINNFTIPGGKLVWVGKDDNCTLQDIENAIKIACDLGYGVKLFCVIGMPGETKQDIEDSLSFIQKYPIQRVLLNNPIPYPGTELYEIIKKNDLQRLLELEEFFQSIPLSMIDRTGQDLWSGCACPPYECRVLGPQPRLKPGRRATEGRWRRGSGVL